MARLGHWGAELGHEHAEGLTTGGTVPTFDTAVKRSGARSFKAVVGAAGTSYHQYAFTGAVGTTYYACMHLYVPTGGFSSTSAGILQFLTGAGGNLCRVDITTAQKLGLLNSGFGLVGSIGTTTLLVNTWYRVELVCRVVGGANDDTLELYLDGTLVASSAIQNIGTTAPGQLRMGIQAHSGTGMTMQWDDIALNDSVGSVNTGLVGDQKIYVLVGTADVNDGNWTTALGGSDSGLTYDASNNIPPVGLSTSSVTNDNAQNENAAATAPNNMDVRMQTYTAAGVGASDTVTAIQTVVEVGSSSTTGTDTISHSVVSNPAIAAGAATSCDIVAGTYPSGWNRGVGTMTENPTVTKGTGPVMRITKDIAITRINACCLMAMVVAVAPAGAPPAGERYGSIMMVGD